MRRGSKNDRNFTSPHGWISVVGVGGNVKDSIE